jgi:hypothetical protein
MDDVLGFLREARAVLLEEKTNGAGSRESSVCATNIDTAILWRQEVLRLRQPEINEVSP